MISDFPAVGEGSAAVFVLVQPDLQVLLDGVALGDVVRGLQGAVGGPALLVVDRGQLVGAVGLRGVEGLVRGRLPWFARRSCRRHGNPPRVVAARATHVTCSVSGGGNGEATAGEGSRGAWRAAAGPPRRGRGSARPRRGGGRA